MAYKLICVHPFQGVAKGQEITDPHLVAFYMADRDHHFVRVFIPDPVEEAPAAEPVIPNA
jgi:hypothetical protein